VKPVLIAATALLAAHVAVTSAQQQVFRTGVQTVAVYATVLDRSGEMLLDLDRDDFLVFDNGRPQELTIFETGRQPITAMLLLDTSASMTPELEMARQAIESFVIRMQPGDRARVGSFSDKIDISREFTGDRDALLRSVRDDLSIGNPTRLWDAVDSAMSELETVAGRRVIMLLTDGNDTASDKRARDIMARARSDELLVYAAQFRPRVNPRIELPLSPTAGQFFGSDPNRNPRPTQALRDLTRQTGGGHFSMRAFDDVNATFTRVIQELRHQYILGFSPAEADGELHEITVRVNQPGSVVRARRHYMAPSAQGGR
jgi:Ca-activated chloride channel family protein